MVNTGGKAMKLLTKGKSVEWWGLRCKGKTERIRMQSLEQQGDCGYTEQLQMRFLFCALRIFYYSEIYITGISFYDFQEEKC